VRVRHKKLPIALMSGLAIADLRQLDELAIECVIEKPFSRASLVDAVAKLLA
jgi:hypothetical protein